MAKHCGLTFDELEIMTIGNCLDFMDEYVDAHNDKKEKKRQANQSDYDSF